MTTWENRIVAYGEVAPEELLAHPENIKLHPKEQLDAMKAVLQNVGWLQPIIVNRWTGYVLDGHLRVLLALQTGATSVPVSYVELDDDEERLALAAINRTPTLAGIDQSLLQQLLRDCTTDDETIAKMLSDFATAAGLNTPLPVGESPGLGPAEEPEPPAEMKPARILVGDHEILVQPAAFQAWRRALMGKVGRDSDAIRREIRRRLRFSEEGA